MNLIGECSKNLALPCIGDNQPGEICYFSLVRLFIFGLLDVSLSSKKLKYFVCAGAGGTKDSRNILSGALNYLDKIGSPTLLPIN